jgi:spore maturation protein CgeB
VHIFLSFHPSGNLSVPGSMTWYRNFYEPLKDLGHDVFFLNLDEVSKENKIQFRGQKFFEIFSRELPEIFKREHNKKPFDFFLSYFTDNDITTETLSTLKKWGVPMANFSCNNTHQFHLVEKISPLYDFNLHSEKDTDIKFKAINANPVWFPMAANPKYCYPQKLDFIYDLSFVGAAYSQRSHYIDCLVSNEMQVDCFGPNWLINKPHTRLKKFKKESVRSLNLVRQIFLKDVKKRYDISSKLKYYDLLNNLRQKNQNHLHYPVSDIEMIRIFNQTKVNLGFTEVFSIDNIPGHGLKQHIHLREFEAPMSGALYMTNYFEELEHFYDVGSEILTFKNEYELIDKSRYYLFNEKAAAKIREKGLHRAVSCHSYQKRFLDFFEKIKIC